MAYYNKREQQLGKQLVWKNTTPEKRFEHFKKYYGVISVGDKMFVTEYESKFRSAAEAIFTEEAHLMGGKLDTLGVYK
jgi:GMP synthase-like glutamine amidotransferase